MSTLLSDKPVWLEESESILALSGRPLALRFPGGGLNDRRLMLEWHPAEPNKVAIKAWWIPDHSSAVVIRYLTEEALTAIHRGSSGTLVLVLPCNPMAEK